MTAITIAYGDGIGHEVVDAALAVMREAGAQLEIETIRVGERVYTMGSQTGVLPSSWDVLTRAPVLLKGPAKRPEDKNSITETICTHFDIDSTMRVVQQCDSQPDVAAIGYISEAFALFEPLQDATPELAGKNKAHPGATMLAAAMLLEHIGQKDAADAIRAALEAALKKQKKRLRTSKFTETVLGFLPLSKKTDAIANL